MKKIVTLILLLSLTVSLFGCAGSGGQETTAPSNPETTAPAEPAVLMVGYARADITPKVAVPLAGYGQTTQRTTDHALDPLYITCIAFRQGEETFLLCSVDMLSAMGDLFMTTRARIARRVGIPAARIIMSCTHTHSAPDISSSAIGMDIYKEMFQDAALEAAQNAVADLTPATLEGAKTQVESMNFIRHYVMNDGTFSGPNFGSTESGYKGHVSDSDKEMLLLKAVREGDKKDVLLMNWQAHPCFTGNVEKKDISADYIGVTRKVIEQETDMLFAFFQGAGGNHNARSSIAGENLYGSNEKYGTQLAKEAIKALNGMKPIEGSGINSETLRYEAAVNHEDEHLAEEAQKVVDMFYKTGDWPSTKAYAHSLGITSVYHAGAIVARPNRPERDDMEINAVTVAGIGLISAPFEMFSETGIYIKENSPYEMTFICTNANEHYYYIPTTEAYEYGCYESFISYYAKGTAEELQAKYIEMLKGLQ